MSDALIPAGVRTTGSFLPAEHVTSSAIEGREFTSAEGVPYRLTPGEIEAKTGIRERRRADAPTSSLAAGAGLAALAKAGVDPKSLDLILLATSTPDHPIPKTAPRVAYLMGAEGVPAYDFGKDCTGFLEALEAGMQYVRTGAASRVLVIGAERTAAMIEQANKATAVVFGDGAGAVLLGPAQPGRGWLGSAARSHGELYDRLYVPAGGSVSPPSTPGAPEIQQRTLRMDGKAVTEYATRAFPEAVRTVLAKCGVALSDVALIIPHQANRRILEKAIAGLGVGEDRVFINVEMYGNTAAASIPIALDEAVAKGRVNPGDLVLLVAYGAGLSWNAALVRW
jgi:3-oxoacyl-[acyl-carrier-protein] synthase-3